MRDNGWASHINSLLQLPNTSLATDGMEDCKVGRVLSGLHRSCNGSMCILRQLQMGEAHDASSKNPYKAKQLFRPVKPDGCPVISSLHSTGAFFAGLSETRNTRNGTELSATGQQLENLAGQSFPVRPFPTGNTNPWGYCFSAGPAKTGRKTPIRPDD